MSSKFYALIVEVVHMIYRKKNLEFSVAFDQWLVPPGAYVRRFLCFIYQK